MGPTGGPTAPSTPQALGEPAYVQLEGPAMEGKVGNVPAMLRWTGESRRQKPGSSWEKPSNQNRVLQCWVSTSISFLDYYPMPT